MKIVVFARIVPDITDELDISQDGTGIDREWIGATLNEYCDYAIEQALVLKERTGGHVTVMTHDANGDDKILKTSIARGADAAVKVSLGLNEEEGIGAFDLAKSVADAVRALTPDLVLTGVQGPEDLFGTFAPYLAAELAMPVLNVVTAISVEGRQALVSQEHAGGRVTERRVALPIVAGIQMSERPPAFVSGTQLRAAMASAKVDAVDTSRIEAAPLAVAALEKPTRKSGVRFLDQDPGSAARQLIEALKDKGFLGAAS